MRTSIEQKLLRSEPHRIVRVEEPDVVLGLLEKRPAAPFRPPLLIVHGATLGTALFDLPAHGYSLIDELANSGRPVYALDIRGFGRSLGGMVMEAPAQANAPFARLPEAVVDVRTAVDFILARENCAKLDLLGFSWGTVTTAFLATQVPALINRLVLYAPLYAERNEEWLDRIADPADRSKINPAIGAYRYVAAADLLDRWNKDLGARPLDDARESHVPQLIFDTLAALDPMSTARSPAEFRCPAGALADLVEIFNGRPLYDPAKLTMPTYLIRGADDTTSTHTDALNLFQRIASPQKDYQVITPGSHFLCVERNRSALYDRINRFLEA